MLTNCDGVTPTFMVKIPVMNILNCETNLNGCMNTEPPKPTSLMWRIGSGIYGTTTGALGGAVGLGTGSVKWVAGKGYNAGSAVVSKTVDTTKTIASYVPKPTLRRKDKKE